MLLPPKKAADGEEAEDPRAELVRRLLEYEQMKLAAPRLDAAAAARAATSCAPQVYIEQSLAPRFPDVDVDRPARRLGRHPQARQADPAPQDHARGAVGARAHEHRAARACRARASSSSPTCSTPTRGVPVLVVTFIAMLELAQGNADRDHPGRSRSRRSTCGWPIRRPERLHLQLTFCPGQPSRANRDTCSMKIICSIDELRDQLRGQTRTAFVPDDGQSARRPSLADAAGAPARRSGRRERSSSTACSSARTKISRNIRARSRPTSTSCRRKASTCCSRRPKRSCIRSRRNTACIRRTISATSSKASSAPASSTACARS